MLQKYRYLWKSSNRAVFLGTSTPNLYQYIPYRQHSQRAHFSLLQFSDLPTSSSAGPFSLSHLSSLHPPSTISYFYFSCFFHLDTYLTFAINISQRSTLPHAVTIRMGTSSLFFIGVLLITDHFFNLHKVSLQTIAVKKVLLEERAKHAL